MTRSSSTPARPQPVTIDDEVEICRDERCSKLSIHAKHDKPFRSRGPKRRFCPTCKEPLRIFKTDTSRGKTQRRVCESCGFTAR